jgi:hypothetical protein
MMRHLPPLKFNLVGEGQSSWLCGIKRRRQTVRPVPERREALEKLIDQVIPYATTNTSIIQSSPVKRRLPPILRGNGL